jgi:hypothetical protein
VQKLTGRIAALNRFIAKLAERSLPFFNVLRGSARVEWGPNTTGKCHSFIDTDEYIQIKFTGPKTNEYKVIFISLGWASMNIWVI